MNQDDDKKKMDVSAATEKTAGRKWYHINRNFIAIKLVIFWSFSGEFPLSYFPPRVYYVIICALYCTESQLPLCGTL